MNLNKILKRLENNFYYNKEHILYDINLIEKNCKLYNTNESGIIKLVEEFVNILKNNLESIRKL